MEEQPVLIVPQPQPAKSQGGHDIKSAEDELNLEICLDMDDGNKSNICKKVFKRSTKQNTDSSVEFVGPNDPCLGSQATERAIMRSQGVMPFSSSHTQTMINT